ncbi:hypothetical protein KAH94_01935 [bacterium]|nr:hypothetical protein [bacterium]
MKRMLKGLLSLAFLVSTSALLADTTCCTTKSTTDNCCDKTCETVCGGGNSYFSYRSQSINAARDIVNLQSLIHRFEMESLYGTFGITPHFTRTFKPCRLAGYFFGEDLVNGALTVSGSGVADRGDHDWLADYFGLSTDFKSSVKFTPRIYNMMVDLDLYLGLDEMWEGGFFRIHAPITYTNWNMNMCETVEVAGTKAFAAGIMDEDAVPLTDLPADFKTAIQGVTFGDMQEALKYGKISTCKRSLTRLSDIEVSLGWNFLQDEDYHLGLMIRGSFPTGNKPCGTYLFEPVVGSGGHWMLGGGLTSHVQLWTSDDEESSFSAYLDANVGHYFKTKQTRSFDLKDKKNSRYMLVQEMGTPVEELFAGDTVGAAVAPNKIYQGKLFPLINKTTFCTDVSIAVQGDMALKFEYATGNWTMDLGYNLWGRTGEKFKEDCCTDCGLEKNKYALKGTAQVVGFGDLNNSDYDEARPLSATQNDATINKGADALDNTKKAWDIASGSTSEIMTTVGGSTQVMTSYQPKTLTCDDLNMCKTPSALSHKLFGHIGYVWHEDIEEDEWEPFVGIGGEVEFAGKTDGYYAAVSQWGVWVKGGVSFD